MISTRRMCQIGRPPALASSPIMNLGLNFAIGTLCRGTWVRVRPVFNIYKGRQVAITRAGRLGWAGHQSIQLDSYRTPGSY